MKFRRALAALAAFVAFLASAGAASPQTDDASPPKGGVLVPPVMIPPGFPGGPVRPGAVLVPLVGEPVGGFPNWSERLMHEWINRARSDPQADLAGCPAGNCPDAACYTPQPPLIWNPNAGRAARYHSAEMGLQNFFGHPSNCTLVSNLDSIYPGSCDGSASCACVGGISACNPTCTDTWGRLALFGVSGTGEIIAAGYADANAAFYGWLWEPTSSSTCAFSASNGHRWLILTSSSAVGTGYAASGGLYGVYYTGDFGDSNSPIPKIPSGTHYPQQGDPIAFWANWYDTAPPRSASVNVDGVCTPLTLGRGTTTNGAWTANVSGLGSGCHRYYFDFVDANGNEVAYPTTGSYGIGAGCADWDVSRGASCASAPPTATKLYTLAPCRVLDTRNATGTLGGPALAGGGAQRLFTVTGTCGIPANAVSISANVTITGPAASGDLRIYPGDQAMPPTSVINYLAGQTRANNAVLSLATNGNGSIAVTSDGGAVQFILDVNGYFQ